MKKDKKTKEEKKLEKQMKKQENAMKPFISSWGYVGYSVLWLIPIVGWLIWFFNLFSKKSNKRNYARSKVCAVVFLFLVAAFAALISFVIISLNISPEFNELMLKLGLFEGYIEAVTGL